MRTERTNHHRARRSERLLRCPQRLLAFLGADHDELVERHAILRESDRIRRPLFRERRFLACPENACRPCPTGGQRQGESQSRRLVPGRRGADLVQRSAGHLLEKASKARSFRVWLPKGAKGGWTRTHVLYMFYTPDSHSARR
ncbi:hypothetical protein DSM104635_02410 [Terricaulis silvestris]|uniref:Uncharacterized protein n=1 Tax=Terricaulis silvestris TaxID=2686094 RepID=A0A6I6MK14_9CAUL|nr:hypothetical protein DSM104635_02410 [Terricaulis silvestris]